jgi:hypothetical protein
MNEIPVDVYRDIVKKFHIKSKDISKSEFCKNIPIDSNRKITIRDAMKKANEYTFSISDASKNYIAMVKDVAKRCGITKCDDICSKKEAFRVTKNNMCICK